MSTTVPKGPLLTIADVAARLNVSEKTVRRMVERSDLPVVRLGHRSLRVDPDELEAWLYSNGSYYPLADPAERRRRVVVAMPRRPLAGPEDEAA
jgi:excisionase family DNA binding protein